MPTTTTTEAGRAVVMHGNEPRLEENASAKLDSKRAEAQRARDALNTGRVDTTTPLVGRAPLEELPEPPTPTAVNHQLRTLTIQIAAVYEGYTVTIAFEGTIQQLPGAIERLRALGVTPTAQPAQQWAYTPDGLPICPRHNAPMKKRERQGDTWFSHVVTGPDGEDCYCRGYKGKESPGYAC
jgi:hypothetical protein